MELYNNLPAFELEKLRAGDNEEWGAFMDHYYGRLMSYSFKITDQSRFCEDIASNAIAAVYVSRQTFNDLRHMVAHMFSLAKYECREIMNGRGNFIMSSDMVERLDYYMSIDRAEMTIEERQKYEEWKDRMLSSIYEQAIRMPKRWKDMIFVYFKYGRNELKKYEREAGIAGTQEKPVIFERLREMIMYNSQPFSEKQLADIRNAFRSFGPRERQVFQEVLRGYTTDQIQQRLSISAQSVKKALEHGISKLRKVWNDPMMGSHRKLIPFVRSIKDAQILTIIEEEFSRDFTRARTTCRLSAQDVIHIILLREQKAMNWSQIAVEIGCAPGAAREAYKRFMNKRSKTETLGVSSVLKIRELYRSDAYSLSALATCFRISVEMLQSIIDGQGITIAGNVVAVRTS